MEQKFVKFEEAIERLGISSERLNELREAGQLRAYRDGSSWKFRGDEIERFATEGLPELSPPSDIGLASLEELVEAGPLEDPDKSDADELKLADEEDDLPRAPSGPDKRGTGEAGGSGIELAELEDTVTAEISDFSLDADDESSDPSDSILLSEEELGESVSTPPSTIIGKNELGADADLDLALADADEDSDESDVRLASDASDVLSSGVSNSGVLDRTSDKSDGGSAFDDLEELEIDLSAESSRAFTPGEAAMAKHFGEAAEPASEGESDLELVGDDEGTDPVAPELELEDEAATSKSGPTSDLELAMDDDEDFVLAESGGSDITLDSADSGINLVGPSDSGLALDDIPLEMGGSAILESLSLGGDESDKDISLMGVDSPSGSGSSVAELQTDDDFQLTPMGESDAEADGDSSSQVIALDAGIEDLEGDAGLLEEDAFAEEAGDAVVLTEDYEGAEADQLGVAAYPSAAVRSDADYTVLNILALASCGILLILCVVVMLDMVRNIWSWDETYTLNSWLLDALLGLFGLK